MQRIRGRSADWEIYSGLIARAPLVARADGRGFKKILEESKKPYDIDFARSMAAAACSLFVDSGLSPSLAFTFSDEVSLVFLKSPFGGRVEKIDSLIAGFLSASLSLNLKRHVSMDCRTIPLCRQEICDYLVERQDEAWRNHVFSYGYYMLRREGSSPKEAMEMLRGLSEPQIHEIVYKNGINLAKTPAWERRGVMIYRRDGQVEADWDLPLFSKPEGKALIWETLKCSPAGL
ncbi:MAG TPA: tRNA(His) guanylyltransferase Thg1 family protein [Methanothrix sp.]|jgi:tRNA(His) 5'-end guanylyltransferase|nr:tRNA(His) guanylyltransferase Thg1 family protein [Methanothrix sp.]HPC90418.1 tRNA(His) guanylyltransferase Thg1 family protein [Methanothrix sp.]HQE88220.1 tRNA(His) guanylyltransferase Thg1 family protein [Methanothrix sp.]HQI68805.1 tRNA(His) guanylyltransferase Thg1 family protein [Methanothrix sp.]HRS85759.1 tRNA(His) guanylyltransferase Thg1 family protein [Methanothrix sp.]